jgi:hypothetical protein
MILAREDREPAEYQLRGEKKRRRRGFSGSRVRVMLLWMELWLVQC